MSAKRSTTSVSAVLIGMLILGICAASRGVRTVWGKGSPSTAPTSSPATAPADEEPEGWFADTKADLKKPPLPEKITQAFVIPIREPITAKTFKAVKRKVHRCHKSKPDLIIFEMDTWGGRAIAALDIARLLKTDLNEIYTVCYVRTRAVSAGALIALACDEIVMTPTGKLGDAAPVSPIGKIEGVEREKSETLLRKEFAESAERNGYPVPLAESMVSITREVWVVRNIDTRELRYVLRRDFSGKVRIPPGVSTAPTNPTGKWELLRVIVTDKELLTLTSREAQEYGFVSEIVEAPRGDELAGVRKHFDLTVDPIVLGDTWSERMVEFLTSPPIISFLFFAGLLCAYVEMHTPGFGVAGGIAIACFAVIFGSGFLVGLAAWWEIALFVIGLALIAVEIFITPGFGILGITGAICCLGALLAMLIPNAPGKWPIPQTDIDWSIFINGLVALGVGFLMACAAAVLIGKYLPKVPVASRLILDLPDVSDSYPATRHAPIRRIAVGSTGTVEHPLRPVGQVRIGQELVDAVAEGEFIPAGTKVKVIKIEGNRVMVTNMT